MTKDEALLEAIEVIEAFERGCDIDDYFMDVSNALDVCKEALAETKEPVAYQPTSQEQSVMHQAMMRSSKLVHKATPPSREWQSLSDDDIWNIANFLGKNKEWDYPVMFAKTIEQALKEKNL